MKKNHCVPVVITTLALGLLMAVGAAATPAVATQPDFICDPFDSGKIDTVGDPATVTVTAPEGFLISGYCVKAGTTSHFIDVDPPSAVVVVDHPVKDSVSHYSLVYVPVTVEPTPTPTPTPTVTTTPTPEPTRTVDPTPLPPLTPPRVLAETGVGETVRAVLLPLAVLLTLAGFAGLVGSALDRRAKGRNRERA